MIVAGLDIASATGVCLGVPGQTPRFWTEVLGEPGTAHEARFSNALRLTHRLIGEHGVTFIGIEAPIIVPNRDAKANNELLMGLVACVRGWAAMKGVESATFEVASVDKHFLGRRMKGRIERKAATAARCAQLGWRAESADEADAGAVWDIACSRLSRSHAVHTTPLMAAGRAR
jgi:hypothetical protein